jgi:hypothetical protein
MLMGIKCLANITGAAYYYFLQCISLILYHAPKQPDHTFLHMKVWCTYASLVFCLIKPDMNNFYNYYFPLSSYFCHTTQQNFLATVTRSKVFYNMKYHKLSALKQKLYIRIITQKQSSNILLSQMHV